MSEPTDSEDLHAEGGEEEDLNEAEIAWAEELRSRIDDVREGRVKLISGAEVSAEIYAILDARDRR